jgi:hypothetical protein
MALERVSETTTAADLIVLARTRGGDAVLDMGSIEIATALGEADVKQALASKKAPLPKKTIRPIGRSPRKPKRPRSAGGH